MDLRFCFSSHNGEVDRICVDIEAKPKNQSTVRKFSSSIIFSWPENGEYSLAPIDFPFRFVSERSAIDISDIVSPSMERFDSFE